MDMLQEGMAWLDEQLKEHASRQVTYRRGELSVTLTVTIGSSLLALGSDAGVMRIERTDRDYFVTAADLVLGGSQVEPAKGDVIEDTNDADGQTLKYEVRPPDINEPAWRWSDHYRQVLRIHTKLKQVS